MKKLILLPVLFGVLSTTAQTKHVLLEESSYATCAQCPEGTFWMDSILKEFPAVIGVTHHIFADSMTIQESADWAADMASGAPTGTIDRVDFGSTGTTFELTTQWRDKVIQQLAATPEVGVTITGSYNSTTRLIDMDVEALFTTVPATGDIRIQCFVIEDSVIGFGSGYDQSNIYNTVSGHPYFGAGDPIVGFPHRHVVRHFMGGLWGTSGVIPGTPATSTPYTQNYTYTLPANFDENQVCLVAFVGYYDASVSNRQVLNATEVELGSLQPSSVSDQAAKGNIRVFPNPTTARVRIESAAATIQRIQVLDIAGRTLIDTPISAFVHELDLGPLPAGVYSIRVGVGEDLTLVRVVKE